MWEPGYGADRIGSKLLQGNVDVCVGDAVHRGPDGILGLHSRNNRRLVAQQMFQAL